MEKRLDKLEAAVDAIQESIRRLEFRLERLEEVSTRVEASGLLEEQVVVQEQSQDNGLAAIQKRFSVVRVLGDLGRLFFIFAGAFILRSITEAGIWHPLVGVSLGLIYSAGLVGIANRFGRKGFRFEAAFYGTISIFIGFPLIWEATVKLKALTPDMALAVLAVFLLFALFVSWYRRLPVVCSMYTLGGLVTATGLLFETNLIEAYLYLIIFLGLASMWIAYTRQWKFVHHVVAYVADVLVLMAGSWVLNPQNLEPGTLISSGAIFWAHQLLIVGYLGSIFMRLLVHRKTVGSFEILQSLLVVGVGFGGSWTLIMNGHGSMALSVIVILILVISSWLAVFKSESRGTSCFYIWQGMIFLLMLTYVFVKQTDLTMEALGMIWLILAFIVVGLAELWQRNSMRYQGAILVFVGAWLSGMFSAISQALIRPFLEKQVLFFQGNSWLTMCFVACCAMLILALESKKDLPWYDRFPRLIIVITAALGLVGWLAAIVIQVASPSLPPTLALVAMVRTGFMVGLVLMMAYMTQKRTFRDFAWLVYPLLIATGIRILMGDLKISDTRILIFEFICYGIALILTPRMMKKEKEADPSDGSEVAEGPDTTPPQ